MKKVIGISGSLRQESYATKLLKAVKEMSPVGYDFEIADISDLPLFNQDLEENMPEPALRLHKLLESADAVLIATPEHNRSYPAALKNALDWGSRPPDQNAWAGKPVAVLGSTPYTLGGFGAVHHLRQVFVFVNMIPLQQPEFYMSQAAEKFNDAGKLTDEETKQHIANLWQEFSKHIDKFA